MEPFFFGDEGRQLLGLYHPPSGPETDRGVIICPPILGDYMRTHSCLRQLAIELARRGYHVLRFDYYGTGDSQGDIQDATIDEWQRNIVSAGDELREIAGVSRITALGVRLGATLAVLAAAKSASIDRLFLWDPITVGGDYVTALNLTYSGLISSHKNLPKTEAHKALAYSTGYNLSPDLLLGVGKLCLTDLATQCSAEIAVLLTDKAKYDAWDNEDIIEDRLFVDDECSWGTFSETIIFGRLLLARIVQRMTS